MLTRIMSSLLVKWRGRRHIFGTTSTTVATVVVPLLVLVLIGTLSYRALEGWTLLDALYATIITITTVGYGDITPQTPGGRVFSIFFTLGAIGLASYAISTLAATVIEKQAKRIEDRIRRQRMQEIADLNNHTIICGATVVGHRAAAEMMRRKQPFILIEEDEEQLKRALMWMNPDYIGQLQRQFSNMELADFESYETRSIADLASDINVVYLHADPTNERSLLQAGIQRAGGLLTAMDDDRNNIAIILSARDMMGKLANQTLRIVSRVSDERFIRRVYLAGADKVTAPNMIGGYQIADSMLSPVIAEMWDQLLFSFDRRLRFFEWRADEHPTWLGRTLNELRNEGEQMALAIHRGGQPMYMPRGDERIAAGDVLIMMGEAA